MSPTSTGRSAIFRCGPLSVPGPILLIRSVRSDDSIFPGQNSRALARGGRGANVSKNESSIFHNQPVPSGICASVTCTSLRLTVLARNRTLRLLIRGAKFRLDLLRPRKDAHISVAIWTRRILPDGFSFSIFVDTASERLADFGSSFIALCALAPRFAVDFLHTLSLVLPGCFPRLAGGDGGLRFRGLSPPVFSPAPLNPPRRLPLSP